MWKKCRFQHSFLLSLRMQLLSTKELERSRFFHVSFTNWLLLITPPQVKFSTSSLCSSFSMLRFQCICNKMPHVSLQNRLQNVHCSAESKNNSPMNNLNHIFTTASDTAHSIIPQSPFRQQFQRLQTVYFFQQREETLQSNDFNDTASGRGLTPPR